MTAHFSTHVILPAQKLVLCYTKGEANYNELIKLNLRCINDKKFDPEFNILMDFRASIAIGYRFDILEYMKFYKQSFSLQKQIQCGLLISTPNQRFLFSIYKPLAKLHKIEAQDFENLENSLSWMNYSDEDKAIVTDALNKLALEGADILPDKPIFSTQEG
jgi:hypothetical protein